MKLRDRGALREGPRHDYVPGPMDHRGRRPCAGQLPNGGSCGHSEWALLHTPAGDLCGARNPDMPDVCCLPTVGHDTVHEARRPRGPGAVTWGTPKGVHA